MIRRFAVTAIAVLFVAACGIPADSSPRPVADDAVPFGLLEEDGAPPSTTTPSTPAVAQVFFVAGDRLAPVERLVPTPLTADKAVEALLAGPKPDEVAIGLRTAISGQRDVSPRGLGGGHERIELGRPFATVPAAEQIFAVAQIVFTATSVPDVGGVVFTFEGRPAEVSRGDGTLATGVVDRGDFAALAPA